MNEREQIERDDESTAAAESCPKPAIDQPVEPSGSLLKVEGTELSSDASTEPSNYAPEPAILSASHSADDPGGAQANNVRGESRKEATTGMGMTITIEHKHSLAIRWMHWINFPLLAVMIYSGLLIY